MNPAWVIFVAGAACAGLLCLEWRRRDRRHFLSRLAATIGAAVALAALSIQPFFEGTQNTAVAKAILWTPGAPPTRLPVSGDLVLALPGDPDSPPSGAATLPDLGTLRRRYPALRTLHILGNGLNPADLPALRGLHVSCEPPGSSALAVPSVVFLSCPRTVTPGENFAVEGRVAGLPPGGTLPLTLEGPDGATAKTQAGPADDRGEAGFRLDASPLPAPGRFEWRLRSAMIDEPLGIAVVDPVLPRVLVLENAPNFDTAALRRWYAEVGGTLTVRTQVGQSVFRYAAARGEAVPFATVDGALLANHDLVLADPVALAGLKPEERAVLRAAIRDRGLGLLVRSEEKSPTAGQERPVADLAELFPWKFVPDPNVADNEERTARLHWPEQTLVAEQGVPVARTDVELSPAQSSLVDDGQGRSLAAAACQGRGFVAVTLVRDTARFLRGNDPAAFAAYWSFLFSRLSRPVELATGRWSLLDGLGPVFVDHPLALRWTGPPEHSPSAAEVTAGGRSFPVALAQDPDEAGVWRGTVWPHEPGWYRIVSQPGEATLDFYVHPRDAWPALQTQRRQWATERFAMESSAVAETGTKPTAGWVVPPGCWFGLLLLSAGYLWAERRLAGGRQITPFPVR